jgi:uncharacterized protein YbaR (Trm112 family)
MRELLIPGAWLLVGGLFALASLAVTVIFFLRARRAGEVPRHALPMVCPSCRRAFPVGTQYCPVDASRLAMAVEGASAWAGHGVKCPRCRRAFEAGMRFCPMDAEELVPLPVWHAQHAEGPQVEHFADHLVGGTGKICPVCAAKYDHDAGFCGRDASELVPIN